MDVVKNEKIIICYTIHKQNNNYKNKKQKKKIRKI